MYPTLAEILELPAVATGRPVVRAGRSALDVAVRWVHVSELPDPAGTLSGGDLVLSIGIAAGDPTTDPAAYLAALRAAGAVGLMIEPGQHLRALPDALVQAARAAAFPLVELRRTVRFVEITEAVHARVLTEQYARLQFAQRVGRAFRGLALDRAGSERVVEEAAHLMNLPVVLEDLGHRALILAGGDAEGVLRDWTARSRQTPDAPVTETAGPEGWTSAPVGRPDRRWARLVVPLRTAGDDRVAMVLAEAADALTLRALTDPDTATPATLAGDRLLADLLAAPNAAQADLRARAAALGLPTSGRFVALVLAPGARSAVAAAVAARRTPALAGTLPGGAVGVVLPCADEGEAAVAEFLAALPDAGPVAVAAATTAAALPLALAEAAHVAEIAPPGRRVWRSRDLGVRGLLHALRDDPRLLGYVDAQLGPILRLDPARRSGLLRSARAFAAADGVIAAFAGLIGTSRPAAYARVRKLSGVLGCDLSDPAAKLSLQVAVLALDATGLED